MQDLIPDILPRLQAHRIPGLSLEGDFLFPSYDGYSLLNIPGGICQLMNAPLVGGYPLAPEILAACGSGIRQIILLIVDGLGLEPFQRYVSRSAPVWRTRFPQSVLAPLTSLTPSTTSAVLTTLWTGRSPAEHGIVGYELWLKEFGMVTNMIAHSAASAQHDPGGLRRSGFIPETFLPVPPLGPYLIRNGVQPYAFMPAGLVHTGLSTMHMADVRVIPYRSPADLWISMADFTERHVHDRFYAYLYWEEMDSLAHGFGPDDFRLEAEFDLFSQAFEHFFLDRIDPAALKDTLFILTADHGQISAPRSPAYDLHNHPDLTRMLHILPTGENRFAYLYVRPGMLDSVDSYIQQVWPGDFSVVPSELALKTGLFGPGMAAANLPSRIGDGIVIARNASYLWWANKENRLVGRHGGLSPQEMLVPFYAIRF